jgi:drug/metabolite transporter (DMT)-like permease
MISIVFAAICALAYGAADFMGGLATRRTHVLRVMVAVLITGIIALLVAAPILGLPFTPGAIKWGIYAGIAGTLGYALVFAALGIGPMSVAAPISSLVASMIPFFFGIASGERLTPFGILGAIVAMISIVLVSVTTKEAVHAVGRRMVAIATAGGFFVGFYLIALSQAPDDSGLTPVLIGRVTTLIFMVIALLIWWPKTSGGKLDWKLVAASGALDVTGGTTFMLATRNGALTVVSVISSLYPALTVLLARLMLHERLERHQKVGLVGAVTAVVFLTLA